MSSNVVEVRLRAVDEFTRQFTGLQRSLGGISTLVKGLFAGLTLRAFVRNIEEAQAAAVQLDVAFDGVADTLGRSRGELDKLADELQRTTKFSDDAVRGAEALLISFDKVRGDAFDRTIKAAADLSARLGTDLSGAVQVLGRALQDPARGMDSLRRSGIVLSSEQRALIKSFLEAGDAAGAQSALLDIVERKYRGAAQAARGTLGGALRALGNSFGDLFEQTREQTDGAVEAIEGLNTALTDPNVKRGIDDIAGGLFRMAEQVLRITAEVPAFTRWLAEVSAAAIHGPDTTIGRLQANLAAVNKELRGRQGEFGIFRDEEREAQLIKRREELIEQLRFLQIEEDKLALARLRSSTAGASGAAGSGGGGGPVDDLAEIEVIARRLPETVGDPYAQFLGDLEDRTRTSLQRQLGDWADFEADLRTLVATGVISAEEATARRLEFLDEEFAEIEVKVKKLPPVVSTSMIEVAEAALAATRDVQAAFTDMFLNIGNGFDDFGDSVLNAFKRMFANLLSTALVSALGIEKIFQDLAKSIAGSTSGSNSGGALQAIGSFIGGFFTRGKASGGLGSGIEVAGEEGLELVDFNRGKVFNRRQLAFAGVGQGGGMTFAPVTTVNIVNPTGPLDQLRAEISTVLAVRDQRQSREFSNLMYRNGFGRLR